MSAFVNTNVSASITEFSFDFTNPRSYAGTGNTVYDLSNFSNNLVLTNSPTYTKSGGGYLTFNGTNQSGTSVALVGSGVTYSFSRTLSMWVRPTTSNDGCICGYGTTVQTNACFEVFQQSNKFRVNIGRGSSGGSPIATFLVASTTTITPNTWYNFVVTSTASNHSYYINGSLDTTASGNVFTQNGTLRLGNTCDGVIVYVPITFDPISYFTGDIAELRIYEGVLDANTIKKNYLTTKSRFGL